MRSVESSFYKTKAWKTTRLAYIQYRNGLCERCMKNGQIAHGKIVHHRIHLTESNINDPDIALGFGNLELLCHDCHNKEHFSGEPNTRYKFDANGEIIF